MSVKFFEVEITFMCPAGAVVPITAKNEEEARDYALELFHDYQNLKVNSVKEISDQPVSPTMLN